jgi:molybdopterin molybdotransferase
MSVLHYILPEQAQEAVLSHPASMALETLQLDQALGRILATDIHSPVDHPLFDQTAVDGYSVRFDDIATGTALRVVDQLRAGSDGQLQLSAGECARIFTGAALPLGADTVVMQEHAERLGEWVSFMPAPQKRGAHVRKQGEQIHAGQLAVPAGTRLNAGSIGFIASLGISEVEVACLPRVTVFVTGDEFAKSQADLRKGLIFESNGVMLASALKELGIEAETVHVAEDLQALIQAATKAVQSSDLLIVTGGVSVGDHDHTRPALEAAGFTPIFHQVRQKPGKPLLFATNGNTAAFGLPGNPRAALLCYFLYVQPWLLNSMRANTLHLPKLMLPLVQPYHRKSDGKVHFVTGVFSDNGLRIEGGQASHMLASFNSARLIVELPAEGDVFEVGQLMKSYIF